MRRNKGFGAASLLLGTLALALAVFVFQMDHYQTFDPRRQPVVLGLFDRFGLVKTPDPQTQTSISPVGLLSINDVNAVELARIYAWWFSICAIGLALFAEWRCESKRFLSVGSVCGCFAVLFLGGAVLGMVALMGCLFVVLLFRSRSRSVPH